MIVRFERTVSGGWGIGMHLVELGSHELVVYSPTWLGEDTFARIESVGKPRFLVAPNHYHHLSLARFRERYPEATAVADAGAMPRLASKGHEGLVEPSQVELPPGMSFVAPEGTKTGELWLDKEERDGRIWIVGDAFFHMTRHVTGPNGLFLRLSKSVPGLCIGNTFRWACLSDQPRYKRWLLERLKERPPVHVGFCHGESLIGADIAGQFTEVAERRLKG